MKITQIGKERVLDTLCNGGKVYRFDTEKCETKNLVAMSINRIVDGLVNDKYVYFIIEA